MGCFSFKCKRTEKPALSSSFDGTACHMFLLKDGKVIEEMFGNYDSYGRVFDGKGGSFKWNLDWSSVCDLLFDKDKSNGIALIVTTKPITADIPTTRSDDDPNQGWGDGFELFGSISDDIFKEVEEPFHTVKEKLCDEQDGDDDVVLQR